MCQWGAGRHTFACASAHESLDAPPDIHSTARTTAYTVSLWLWVAGLALQPTPPSQSPGYLCVIVPILSHHQGDPRLTELCRQFQLKRTFSPHCRRNKQTRHCLDTLRTVVSSLRLMFAEPQPPLCVTLGLALWPLLARTISRPISSFAPFSFHRFPRLGPELLLALLCHICLSSALLRTFSPPIRNAFLVYPRDGLHFERRHPWNPL